MESADFPLYITVQKASAKINRAYACIYFVAILVLIWYRITHIPNECYLTWIVVFGAELGFAFCWILDQAFRWRPVCRETFPKKLSDRFEKELPPVDIFICTADPTKEPPLNTILKSQSFGFLFTTGIPSKKDAQNNISMRAMITRSRIRASPVEWGNLKNMYEDMKYSINSTVERGSVPQDKWKDHKGFKEWSSGISSRDHHSIVEMLLQKGKDSDVEGNNLARLWYTCAVKSDLNTHTILRPELLMF
ncbi:hypothetical protein KI387_040266, partial [Taxus chinensis]